MSAWGAAAKRRHPIDGARRYSARMTSRPDSLDRARLRVVLLTIAINVAGVLLLTMAPWSDWRTGLALNLLDNVILIIFIIQRRDALLFRLLIFGLAVGVAELPADAWLVDTTKTLDYSIGGGPMLWRSPIWMPFAWQIVTIQFGYVGMLLWERFAAPGLLMIGMLGAVNIPFYEEMARRISWWSYSNCKMISFTPYYIIAGEFGIAVALALLASRLRRGSYLSALWLGAAGGAAIFICYFAAWTAIDGAR